MRPTSYNRLLGSSKPRSYAAHVQRGSPVATASSRRALTVVADLSAKGRAILPKSLTVQRHMGEGSFGQVFEGSLNTPAGTQRVVLKRVKTRVQGAEAMSQMEHLLNVYASRVARGHCADFLGYCEVADSEATVRLTPGLWLIWKYEGSKTLSYYLGRRDTLRALAADMEVPEAAVVPAVMKQIFEGLAAFHAAGLVHRDIKPLNIIFAEDVRRFKLIDLGACADLRTGTNYVPEESILDLNYCPPEQYVMPTDSPHIAKQARLLKLAISPLLWAKHKPDRFDTWSAGIVMLQLAVPAMRTDRALRAFNSVYGPKFNYDLATWRRATYLPARDCALLDAFDGAGWELLQSLLAPRHIQVDDNGGVSFVNDSPFPRISAYEALKHKFIRYGLEAAAISPQPAAAAATPSRPAAQPATSQPLSGSASGGRDASPDPTADVSSPGWRLIRPPSISSSAAAAAAAGSGSGGRQQLQQVENPGPASEGAAGAAPPAALASALGLWRDMTGRLFDLESKLMRQASATQLQTTTVKRLREQVESGQADPAVLQKEEKVLNKMQTRLASLQQDFTSMADQASGMLNFLGMGRGKALPTPADPQRQRPQQGSGDAGGSADGQQPAPAGRNKPNLQALRAASAASASAFAAASSASNNPDSSSSPSPPSAGMFSSLWERLSSQLAQLESKISNQASATQRQSMVVRGLRAKVDSGEAEPELLERAERILKRMEGRLLALDRDFRVAKESASGALAGNVSADLEAPRRSGGTGSSREQPAGRGAGEQGNNSGSFWPRLLGGPSSGSSSGGSSSGGSSSEEVRPSAEAQSYPAQQSQAASFIRSLSPLRPRSSSSSPFQGFLQTKPPQDQQQQQQQPQHQPQQQQQALGYRSIFGSFSANRGSGSSGSGSSGNSGNNNNASGSSGRRSGSSNASRAPSASTPATTSTPPPSPPSSSSNKTKSDPRVSNNSKTGNGGLFNGLFGRPRQDTDPQGRPQSPPQQQRPSSGDSGNAASAGAPRGAAGLGRSPAAVASPQSSSSPASSFASGAAAAAAPVPSGDVLLEGAGRVIRSSLGFTGLAARVAGDMAVALKAEADRYFKELEAQEAAKRQQRASDLAFLALLREAHPPLTGRTSYQQAEARFGGDERWTALAEEPRRRQLYDSFLQATRRLEEQARAAAEASFKAALRRLNVTASSNWAEVQSCLLETDPALSEVQDEERRQQLFLEVVSELQLQAALQEAARKAEAEFTAMLEELSDPRVTSTSTWSLVRRAVASDPRFQALPEHRRRELFEAYTARLFEATACGVEGEDAAAGLLSAEAAEDSTEARHANDTLPAAPPSTLAAAVIPAEAGIASSSSAVPVAYPLGLDQLTGNGNGDNGNGNGGPSQLADDAALYQERLTSTAAAAAAEDAAGTRLEGGSPPAAGNGTVRRRRGVFEGGRLEELRREQARLRAEYDAMAQRLREMEERLSSQAQLVSAVAALEAAQTTPAPAPAESAGAAAHAAATSASAAPAAGGAAAAVPAPVEMDVLN